MSYPHLKNLIKSAHEIQWDKLPQSPIRFFFIPNITHTVLSSLKNESVKILNQQHTTNYITNLNQIDEPADGIVLSQDSLKEPVAIKTADCLPLVGINKEQFALIHAGWKGLLGGICESIINNFPKMDYFMGPAICQNHFKVGQDFYDNWHDKEHFTVCYCNQSQTFDLKKYAQLVFKSHQLNLHVHYQCTYCETHLASYRQTKTAHRNLTLAIPEKLISSWN